MRPSISIPILLTTSLVSGCVAAENTEDILKRHIEADNRNHVRAESYAYTSKETQFQFDKQGNVKSSRSRTFDEMFVEGQPYRRLVAKDDKALSAKDAAEEEKRQQQTAEERRRGRRNGVFHKSVSAAESEDLLNLETCQIAGEGALNGRSAWVLQCDPRTDRMPANPHEKDVQTFRQRLWIDKADFVRLKAVNTALEGNPTLLPGSTMTFEYALINNDVWMLITLVIDGNAQFAKMFKPKVRTEYKNEDFKKFDVQSTITPEASAN